jgi:peroxiredoxin
MRELYRDRSVLLAAFLLAAFLQTLAVTAPLSAGGRQEAQPEASARDSVSQPVQRRSAQKELLSSIGVWVFQEDIAAVDFTLENLQGEDVRLRDHRGQLIFLNFWATWCPPCREEMPAMEIMHTELGDLPFTILAVSVQEERNTVTRYIDQYGYTFPILRDPTGRISSNYGVRGLPTTYFVSSDGFVLGMIVGILDWKDPAILAVMREVLKLEESADVG